MSEIVDITLLRLFLYENICNDIVQRRVALGSMVGSGYGTWITPQCAAIAGRLGPRSVETGIAECPALHGRPMQFATDPAQHHVEGGPYDRLEVKQRIEADWAPWFAPAPWRVEKSPVNLTRMRLYQQLFPRAQFVVVLRHPQAVAAAVAKWVDADQVDLVAHWLDAHDIVRADLDYLHSVLVLRYEDIVARPAATLAALAAFLDLSPDGIEIEPVRDGNADYPDHGPLPQDLADRLRAFGYGDGGVALQTPFPVRHTLRDVREAVSRALDDPSPPS